MEKKTKIIIVVIVSAVIIGLLIYFMKKKKKEEAAKKTVTPVKPGKKALANELKKEGGALLPTKKPLIKIKPEVLASIKES